MPSVLSFPSVLIGAALGAAGAFWTVKAMWVEGDHATRRAVALIAALWLLSAVHAAIVVAQIGHFSHVTRHYYGWLFIAWSLWLSVAVVFVWQRWPASRRRLTLGAVLTLMLVLQSNGVASRLRTSRDPDELRNTRTDLMGWIESHLPAGAPIASWNAGQFGYFLDRPVVNLDGLVNDAEFAHALRRGEPILNYLDREGIRYIVDYNDPDLSMTYRATWDRRRFFRGEIPFDTVDILLVRAAEDHELFVLRTKAGPGPQ